MRLDGIPSLWGGLGRGLSALATLQELRLAVGVTRGRMMGCYFLMGIIRLSITPSAKRNTLPFRVAKRRAGDLRFSVAILLWFNTQGRGAAHLNPGLGKRNSYRVAKGAYRLLWANHTLQQGAPIHLGKTIHCSRERTIRLGIIIHYSRERTSHIGLTTHGRWERTIYDALLITNALINMEHDEGG